MANKVYTNATSYSKAVAITPDDNNDLVTNSRALSFSNTGVQTLSVIFEGDTAAVSLIAPTGVYPFAVKRIRSTGTTVTNIVAYV